MQNKEKNKLEGYPKFISRLKQPLVIADADGTIDYANQYLVELFHNEKINLIGNNVANLLKILFITLDNPGLVENVFRHERWEQEEELNFSGKDAKGKSFGLTISINKLADNPKYLLLFSLDHEEVVGENGKLFSPSTIFDPENNISAFHPFLDYAKKQLTSLVENAQDIIYIIDLKKRKVIYFNKEFIFDYPKKDLERSEGWIELVHPDDIKKVKAHWNKFLKTGLSADQVEYRLKRKSEEYEWVVNRHTIIERDAEGDPILVLLNITVITERKKAEEALRESEARLLALIDNTNDIIWSVDKDLQFTAMNSSFRTQFRNEFKKEIRVGENLLEILPSKISGEWLKNHKKALGGERFTTEFTLSSKKRNFSYEISYNPIYSSDGVICGVSVFGRDITARKLAENDIIRTNFELDSFVYRASHDLRAPLRSVLGLINIVKTEENTLQRNHYLNLVDKSINKLDTFISDLTNFSRNSRLEVRVEPIDFRTIIEESVENLKYMDNAKQIDIRMDIQDGHTFFSDSGRISIILQNLLSNSIKYRNPKVASPYVSIKVNIQKHSCIITMEDNGRGIKEEYLDKIFNMFFRASDDSYGSGLGLYITKQVIEKLKGEISVNSSIGSGSIFEIKLPNLQKK